MRKLGFDIPGEEGDVAADIEVVAGSVTEAEVDYLIARLHAAARKLAPEAELVKRMSVALGDRPMRDYTALVRPDDLPRGTGVPGRRVGADAQRRPRRGLPGP